MECIIEPVCIQLLVLAATCTGSFSSYDSLRTRGGWLMQSLPCCFKFQVDGESLHHRLGAIVPPNCVQVRFSHNSNSYQFFECLPFILPSMDLAYMLPLYPPSFP